MRIEETIPDPLAAEAEAARAWFAAEQASEFKLTGIVDPDAALAEDADARELRGREPLVLSDRLEVRQEVPAQLAHALVAVARILLHAAQQDPVRLGRHVELRRLLRQASRPRSNKARAGFFV